MNLGQSRVHFPCHLGTQLWKHYPDLKRVSDMILPAVYSILAMMRAYKGEVLLYRQEVSLLCKVLFHENILYEARDMMFYHITLYLL